MICWQSRTFILAKQKFENLSQLGYNKECMTIDGGKLMNVMVCVTQQKSCERLIKYGQSLIKSPKSELFIIHVASKKSNFLNSESEAEALDYLFEKSQEIGANLTVIKSNNVMETLVGLVEKNKINHVVMGTSGQMIRVGPMAEAFQKHIEGIAEITFVPPNEIQEEV